MSPEAKARIAEAVKQAVASKRVTSLPSPLALPSKPLEIHVLGTLTFPPDMWVPHLTHTPVDALFTPEGGIPKGTNWILVGDPGVGKSTVGMTMLASLTSHGARCLFVSAEMTRVDLAKYVQRFPGLACLQTLFLGEFLDANPQSILEEALNIGFDVVLIDSFVEVQECLQESQKCSSVVAQKQLVDLMKSHNLGSNLAGKYSTFLCIQQVTKDGVFLGSNRLKHATTGMLEMRFDEDNPDLTYLEFTKNRRGAIGHRLYFDLRAGGNLEWQTPDPQSEEHPEVLGGDLAMRALARLYPE